MPKKVVKKTTKKASTVKKMTVKSETVKKKTVQKKKVVAKQEVQPEANQVAQKPKLRLKKKYIVFLSLYVLSFIMYYSVTSFARYTSLINQTGNITVAKWDVSLSGEDDEVLPTITIGDDSTYQDYDLTVSSKSEVGITYSLVISNVPSDLRLTIDEQESYTPNENNKIIVDNLGTFNASSGSELVRVHKLKFIVPIDSDAFDNQTLNIDVVFSQVEL